MTGINSLSPETYELSSEAAKLQATINEEITAFNNDVANLTRERAALEAIAPSDITPDNAERSRKFAWADLELKRAEATIRNRLHAEWYPVRTKERHAAFDRAIAALSKAANDVTRKLEKIGYGAINPETGTTYVQAYFVNGHPDVIAAGVHCSTVGSMRNEISDMQANKQALDGLQKALADAGRHLMAIS